MMKNQQYRHYLETKQIPKIPDTHSHTHIGYYNHIDNPMLYPTLFNFKEEILSTLAKPSKPPKLIRQNAMPLEKVYSVQFAIDELLSAN